jgi:hypothetical protein
VVVRQHLARGGQHHPGAGGLASLVAQVRVDDDDAAADGRGGAAGEREARADEERGDDERHEGEHPGPDPAQ